VKRDIGARGAELGRFLEKRPRRVNANGHLFINQKQWLIKMV
jgi:hypothetical protein